MSEDDSTGEVSIFIGNGVRFYIDGNQQMWIADSEEEICLGQATERRLDTMLLHMGSMRVHTKRGE